MRSARRRFCSVLPSLARLLRDTGWGHGGIVFLCIPWHCLAVSIVQALSRLCNMGLEVIDG